MANTGVNVDFGHAFGGHAFGIDLERDQLQIVLIIARCGDKQRRRIGRYGGLKRGRRCPEAGIGRYDRMGYGFSRLGGHSVPGQAKQDPRYERGKKLKEKGKCANFFYHPGLSTGKNLWVIRYVFTFN